MSRNDIFAFLTPDLLTLDSINDKPVPKIKTPLRCMKLTTDEQRRALAALRVPFGGQREFRRLILAHLALIADKGHPAREEKRRPRVPLIASPNGQTQVPAIVIRELRRLSSSARGMARQLQEQSEILQDFA